MKKGLRQAVGPNLVSHLLSLKTRPDEEGIKTEVRHHGDPLFHRLKTRPDEEGIKTVAVGDAVTRSVPEDSP